MSTFCSTDKFRSIRDDLVLYSDELNTLEEVSEFLKETHSYTLESLLNNLEDTKLLDELKSILDDEYKLSYAHLLDKQSKETSTINNIISNFSSPEVPTLFHTMQVAENYFNQSTKEQITKAILLGAAEENKFVSTDKELNANIKSLKNQLLSTIRSYLKLADTVLLYDKDGNFISDSYDIYQSTIHEFEEYLKNNYPVMKTPLGNLIPILRADLRRAQSRNLLDAYNAAVFLVNFDSILDKEFGDLIKIDYAAFNNFVSAPDMSDKYALKVKGIETVYWSGDSHNSESVEKNEVKLAQLIVNSIPQLNKEGEFMGTYLEMKDFYGFAALLKDFELTNYNELKKSFPD